MTFLKATQTFLDHHETIKNTGDVAAITITLGTIFSLLPAIAAIFTIIWTGIRIYETDTVQKLVKKKHKRRRKTDE
jgi:hypothetical protein